MTIEQIAEDINRRKQLKKALESTRRIKRLERIKRIYGNDEEGVHLGRPELTGA